MEAGRAYEGDGRTGTVLLQSNNTPGLAAVVASAAFVANFTWTDNPLSIAHLTIDGNMYVRALSLSLSISLSFSQSLSLSLFPVAFQHIKRVVW